MEITLSEVRAHCVHYGVGFEIDPSGMMRLRGTPISTSELRQALVPSSPVQLQPRQDAIFLQAEGYETLALVLQRAFIQAAHGKGKERHANGEPFTRQVMQDGARRFGVGALLFQAFKKSEESQRLPLDRGVNELLGAIVYLAGAVIAREAQEAAGGEPLPPIPQTPANDNAPCCAGGTQTAARCTGCVEATGLKAESLRR